MFGSFNNQGRVRKDAPSPADPHALALYRSRTCGYCRRVERALDGLGLQVELRDVDADYDHRRTLNQVTGRSTVPCLFIDGQPMFESLDIIAWLEAHAAAIGTTTKPPPPAR